MGGKERTRAPGTCRGPLSRFLQESLERVLLVEEDVQGA